METNVPRPTPLQVQTNTEDPLALSSTDAHPTWAITPSTPRSEIPPSNPEEEDRTSGGNGQQANQYISSATLDQYVLARSSLESLSLPKSSLSRRFSKHRSEHSIKEGLKATAHAVRGAAHVAKEALKDTVNPQRHNTMNAALPSETTSSFESLGAIPTPYSTATASSPQMTPFMDEHQSLEEDKVGSSFPESPDQRRESSATRYGNLPWSRRNSTAAGSAPSSSERKGSIFTTHSELSPHNRRSRSTRHPKSSHDPSTRDIKKFIKAFANLSENGESLLKAYSCAWERDVLWHGRIYLTNEHLCFYGKLFGKSSKISLNYSDITSIEKKNTAGMFPNAIRVTATDKKFVFASFLKREAAFQDMITFWERANGNVSPTGQTLPMPTTMVLPDHTPSHSEAALSDRDDSDGSPIVDLSKAMPISENDTLQRSASALAIDSNSANSQEDDQGADQNEMVRRSMDALEGPPSVEDTLKRPLRHSSSVGSLNSLTDTGTTGNSSAPTLGKQARALTIASDFIRRIMPKCNEDGELINAPVGSTSTYTQDEGGSPAASNTVGAGTQSSKPTIKPILLVNDTQISASSAAKPSPLKPALSAVLPSTLKQASKVMSTTEVATAPATIALSASGVATVAPDTKDKNVSRQRLLIARPAEPVTCNCESHHEHETCNVILDLDVEAVYDAIFCKEGSEVVREAHRRRETEDVKFGEWAMDPATSNPTSRDLVYTISFKPPMFAKQVSQASERQVVMRYEPYAAYVVECNIKTPKVPYGECFTVYNRYCITHAGPGKTRVKITSKVDFNKRLMWKNQIEAATIDGMRGFCSELVSLIRKTGQRAKAGDLGSAAPDVSKSADGLSIQDAATANNTPLSGSPPNIHIEESSGMKSSLFSRLNAVAAHKFESLGSSSNHGSSLLWAVLVCLFILGFCLSALNVYWVMDIGRKLDRTAQEIARVKAGEASAVEDIFRVGTEKLLPKEEDIRYLRPLILREMRTQMKSLQSTLRDTQLHALNLQSRLNNLGEGLGGAARDISNMFSDDDIPGDGPDKDEIRIEQRLSPLSEAYGKRSSRKSAKAAKAVENFQDNADPEGTADRVGKE